MGNNTLDVNLAYRMALLADLAYNKVVSVGAYR
jgi:hypothetical protein